MKQLICPVSSETINERVTRLNAFFGIIVVMAGFIFNSVIFLVFLTADFYTRAFSNAKYSPISYLSHRMANALNLDTKNTDKAPKIFAARLGFLMSLTITLLMLLQFNTLAYVVGGILVFFASLEFVLAICMGCIIYTYLVLPFYRQ